MRRMIAADYLNCSVNEPFDDCLPIPGRTHRWVHFEICIVIGPRGMRSSETFLIPKNSSAVLLPERIASRNSRVGESKMVRASLAGNRQPAFARRTKQFDTSSAAQVLAMNMRTGQFSKDDIARHDH